MNSLPRGITVFLTAVFALALQMTAFGSTGDHTAKQPAALPFKVNLAPGDVLVHGSDRGINTSDTYQQHDMVEGDQVIGSIGKLRSVILTGDASAVEVLPGSTLTASSHQGRSYLDLNKGMTRVGRASTGDGTPIRLLVRTHQVGAVVHGGDVLLSKSSANTTTVVQPEPDGRYLFSGRVSLLDLTGDSSMPTIVPSPMTTYDDSGHHQTVTKVVTVTATHAHAVHGTHYHHYRHRHHHKHHHRHGSRHVMVHVSVK